VTPAAARRIRLVEHRPQLFPAADIRVEDGAELWRTYSKMVTVEFPSPKTDDRWELKSEGWVGYIPVSADLALELYPKVPLANIFRMLEYAYALDPKWLAGLVASDALEEFFERLAAVLAKRVLARARHGLHRAYVTESDLLPFVRGALDLADLYRRPASVSLACEYQDHTADIDDNRILAWTLSRIARSAYCSDRSRPQVRRAYHAAASAAQPAPFLPGACASRTYHRLNDDYRGLHALCRFFLENTGPTHEAGRRTMLPFLIEMSGLFERFVAEWLQAHLPPGYRLQYQEPLNLGGEWGVDYRIDMVLYDRTTDAPRCVLDAKYKAPERVDQADFNQVVVYAKAKQCSQAFLVYPVPLPKPVDAFVDDIRVRSVTFGLDGELDAGGLGLLGAVIG